MATDNPKAEKTAQGGERENSNNRSAIKANRQSFSTHDGHSLTPPEALFIDRYIETGNGRQSYIEAYPNCNPKSAAQLAQKKLNKDYITSEINHRLESAKTESIANAEEIMQYLTNVMRGNEKDQFGLEVSISERTKAATELAKRLIDIPNRLAGNEQPELKITLDWARPTDNGIGDDGK